MTRSVPARPALSGAVRPVAVVGGAGFIGCNIAESFLAEGRDVIVADTLARPGVERNLAWLTARHGARVHHVAADVRDPSAISAALEDAGAVVHLAAQVAVTTSLEDPVADFEVNARGTLNVLEAVRRTGRRVPVVFASTNKVYGSLEDLGFEDVGEATLPRDPAKRAHGVPEARNLDFCTPYGCSKGVADQYVLDWAKSYGLPTAVLRMSCIYGPHQFGTEDQGWLAHFLIRALRGEPITIYGTGRQVRDVLHVSDAVAAYRAVLAGIEGVKGRAFNLGGGPANAVSLNAALAEIARLAGREIRLDGSDWRRGDQPWFVADTRALQAALGWTTRVGWRDGLADLADWLRRESGLILEDRRLSA
ncbi:NAD-dependent epimerase/dehydratase family protein [Prosthecomicrobium sp. N25]|uniref:NAD-dependent epimerase/dehydratase family protein n=1 Tax=Prosthecomicrobium sp. N25 TaxID=3129254 RepID=UPI0030777E82